MSSGEGGTAQTGKRPREQSQVTDYFVWEEVYNNESRFKVPAGTTLADALSFVQRLNVRYRDFFVYQVFDSERNNIPPEKISKSHPCYFSSSHSQPCTEWKLKFSENSDFIFLCDGFVYFMHEWIDSSSEEEDSDEEEEEDEDEDEDSDEDSDELAS